MAKGRGLKICLAVSLLLLIIATVVIVTLSLTVFKPKNPVIRVDLVGIENFQFPLSANSTMNVTLDTLITIVNPNYGSFNYINSTAYVNYDNTIVGEVPIGAAFVPARGTVNVTTGAIFMVGKLIQDPKFWSDVVSGSLNLTSTAELPGKASILKFIKLRATAYSSCDISVSISSMHAVTKCIDKIKV